MALEELILSLWKHTLMIRDEERFRRNELKKCTAWVNSTQY